MGVQVGATKNVAWRFRNEGIRCNAVLPGAIDSSIGNKIASGHNEAWDAEGFAQVESVISEPLFPSFLSLLFFFLFFFLLGIFRAVSCRCPVMFESFETDGFVFIFLPFLLIFYRSPLHTLPPLLLPPSLSSSLTSLRSFVSTTSPTRQNLKSTFFLLPPPHRPTNYPDDIY